jgi:GNAT superfamily N-acetyltransferase
VELTIRRGTPGDAAGLARVHTLGWQQGFAGLLPADWLARRVVDEDLWSDRLAQPLPRATVFVAEGAGEVVGFAHVGPVGGEPDPATTAGQLYALYVLADHWGTGVGYRLHQAGLAALVADGFRSAVLWALPGSVRSLTFYQRQGWRLDGEPRTQDLGGLEAPLQRLVRPLP